MNGIKYPADEIAKAFKGLEKTPAPFGHPMVNGKFVSARDPEGLNLSFIGAHNENVRRQGGRVFLDKVIDVAVANATENGRRVIEAVNKGEPVNTSTGLLCDLSPAEVGATDHKYVARNMRFDHDAILLDTEGAATPKDGVGMFVNSAGEEMDVINSAIDLADSDVDWAVESLMRAVDKSKRAPLADRVKAAVLKIVSGLSDDEPANEDEPEMSKEELEKIGNQVTALNEAVSKIGETVANAVTAALKPVTDAHEATAVANKAAADAEHAEFVGKVVANKLLPEDVAKATPIETLKALVANVNTGRAAPVIGGNFQANTSEGRKFAPPAAAK